MDCQLALRLEPQWLHRLNFAIRHLHLRIPCTQSLTPRFILSKRCYAGDDTWRCNQKYSILIEEYVGEAIKRLIPDPFDSLYRYFGRSSHNAAQPAV
jgi:hypothetical protein